MDCKITHLSAVFSLVVLCLGSVTATDQVESRASAPNWLAVVPNHWMCAGHNAPVLFPHDSDCSRYYECVCEDAYEYACEKGLRFNSQTLHCDQSDRVACQAEASVSHPSVNTEGSIEQPAIDPRCPSMEAVKHWSDETNCSRYYQCVRGEVMELQCPESLVWDNAAKKCSAPNPNKCCAPVPAAPTLEEQSVSLWDRFQSWMG
ncbi:peritrophin-1-like [Anopheles marshallii]|uniref:peritrophin-1-like n=1 Tax=Anopheles marshallii TaxID=1521116 RepID=UPI00237B23B6|nr:peritrophin-1-like [Anopheles marshallii]